MRILLVKTSSLGDVIHHLPVASDLRRRFPRAEIHWCVEESFAEIPALHPAIDAVIPVALRRWKKAVFQRATWREIKAVRQRLQAVYYDVVLDSQGLLKSALITRSAFGRSCGFSSLSAREPLAASFYHQTYTIPKKLHAVIRNRWLAGVAFGYAEKIGVELPLDYGLCESKLELAPSLLSQSPASPYLVMLTATSRANKTWPEASWMALGRRLQARGILAVFPSGSSAEWEVACRIAALVPGAIAPPRLSLTQTAALLKNSVAVVGVDTGLAHFAVALERPSVGIYTATSPMLTGLYGAEALVRNLGGVGACPDVFEVERALDEVLNHSN